MAEYYFNPVSILPRSGFISTRSEGDFIILTLFDLPPDGGIPRNDDRFPDFLGSSAEIIGFNMKLLEVRPLSLAFVDVG